jgi:hypothetical protein
LARSPDERACRKMRPRFPDGKVHPARRRHGARVSGITIARVSGI